MKSMRIWSIIIMAAIMLSMVSACGGDDNDGGNSGGNSLIGWYCSIQQVDLSNLVKEGLTLDEHFEGGMYSPHTPSYYDEERGIWIPGLNWTENGIISAIHIIDDHNLVKYGSYGMWQPDHEWVRDRFANKTILYQFTAGSLGKLVFYDFYDSETYYTYTREGNTISVYLGKDDDGKDDYLKLNILPDGLVESGAPKWVKYDPNTVYDYNTSGNILSEPSGNSSSGNQSKGQID